MRSPNPGLAVERSLAKLKATIPQLQAVGFDEVVYEPFYDVLHEVIENIVIPSGVQQPYQTQGGLELGTILTNEKLLLEFQDPTSTFAVL